MKLAGDEAAAPAIPNSAWVRFRETRGWFGVHCGMVVLKGASGKIKLLH